MADNKFSRSQSLMTGCVPMATCSLSSGESGRFSLFGTSQYIRFSDLGSCNEGLGRK